jgi:hypothetical protein
MQGLSSIFSATAGAVFLVLSSTASLATPLTCRDARSQVLDGLPGPGRLLAISTGCPVALASQSNGDADSNATVTVTDSAINFQHTVDIKASATFRFSISEAFARLEVPLGAPAVDLVLTSNLDPLRFSAVLQFARDQERITLVLGSPILPGESTVWTDSDGTIATSSLFLTPGSTYTVYSRLASYGEVNHGLSLLFSTVPEPTTGLLLGIGLGALLAGRRSRRPQLASVSPLGRSQALLARVAVRRYQVVGSIKPPSTCPLLERGVYAQALCDRRHPSSVGPIGVLGSDSSRWIHLS